MSGYPMATIEEMQDWAAGLMASRPADHVIGEAERPYLRRWWVIPRNPFANVYLHEVLRSDDDRAGHDHPWPNTSVVIAGEYHEVMYDLEAPWIEIERRVRRAGDVVMRKAIDTHRLIVPEGGRCVSLFITGQKARDWGFWCPEGRGFVPWRDFTGGANGEIAGKGCAA